jgi:uncharacterized repeat protein (TIGR01451 family)
MRERSIRLTGIEHVKIAIAIAIALSVIAGPVSAAPGGNADLSITGSGSSPGVKVGHDVTFALQAVNLGPQAASNVTVEVIVDPDLTIQTATALGGTCTTTAIVVCSRDSLPMAGSFRVIVRATTTATGPSDATGAVESDTTDGTLTNNTVTLTTQVGAASSDCDLWGTSGNDRISGGAQGEVICGRGGKDRVAGRGGGDRLLGGAGRDVLLGGAGNELLIGGAGRDRLFGGPGMDRCRRRGGDIRRSCS